MIEVGTRVSVKQSANVESWAGKSGEVLRKVEKVNDITSSQFDWVVGIECKGETPVRVAFSEHELELERVAQLRGHAERIATWWLEGSEYSNVYEDEDLPLDITEDEMKSIHDMIVGGKVVISID